MHRHASLALLRSSAIPVHLSLLALLALSSGCRAPDPRLVIVARSDLAPVEEVDRIDVELVGVGLGDAGVTTTTSIGAGDDLATGTSIYEHTLAPLDGRHVRLRLFHDGEPIGTRDLVFDQRTSLELVVDLPRLCVDVTCDEGETCVRGQCASSRCVTGDEEGCPDAMCTSNTECAGGSVACAVWSCTRGVCWATGDDSCGDDAWCDPLTGCTTDDGVVVDAGTEDETTDAATDGDAEPPAI